MLYHLYCRFNTFPMAIYETDMKQVCSGLRECLRGGIDGMGNHGEAYPVGP